MDLREDLVYILMRDHELNLLVTCSHWTAWLQRRLTGLVKVLALSDEATSAHVQVMLRPARAGYHES